MTKRERIIETLLFRKADKVPLWLNAPRDITLKRWHKEGLPLDRDWHEFILEKLGIRKEEMPKTINLGAYSQMIPEFEEKILEHKDGRYIIQDKTGAILEISDEYDPAYYFRIAYSFVTRKWHKFPVENRLEWKEMKKRYDPKTQGRYPADLAERCAKWGNRDVTLSIHLSGPFWQLREWCGFENLCIFMAEDPDFVGEMANFWENFMLQCLEPVLSRIQPDHICISEDMAYKQKSMISPAMVRQFLLPTWQVWVKRIKESGCQLIELDSDGYIGELIPLWIEAGINICSPIEVAAGNDLPAYRKKFGKNMAYMGGIDKRAIAKGGKVLKEEIMRVVPPLLKDGGYIPSSDHGGITEDISWANYMEYSRL